MKQRLLCILLLLPVLLTPASANSTPTRLGGTGGSALEVDEDCPVTISAEQLTFTVGSEERFGQLPAQVSAVYQMENPTEEPLTVQMAFYLEEYPGQVDTELDLDAVSVTADGQALEFTCQEVSAQTERADRYALVYTVDFPAGDGREVAVSYRCHSFARREGTTHWTHDFTYLLSPAQHWAQFGTLDITVHTPEEFPYIVASSLPFEQSGEGLYTAHSDGLPQGALTFTLYPEPSIGLWDRIYGTVTSYSFTAALMLLGPVVLIAAAIAAVVLIRRRKGQR